MPEADRRPARVHRGVDWPIGRLGSLVAGPEPSPQPYPRAGEARPESSDAAHIKHEGGRLCRMQAVRQRLCDDVKLVRLTAWVNSVMLHRHGPLTGSRQPELPLDNVTGLRQTVACVRLDDGHRELDRADEHIVSHDLNVIHFTLSHDHRRPITMSGNPLSTVAVWPYESCTHEALRSGPKVAGIKDRPISRDVVTAYKK